MCSCSCFSVSVQSITINAPQGSLVTLPCSSNQTDPSVFWRYRDRTTVCDIIDGKADFDEQDLAYKGRVEIFPEEIKKGNFSIKLLNLSTSDTGTYTCNLVSSVTPQTVQLNVTGVCR